MTHHTSSTSGSTSGGSGDPRRTQPGEPQGERSGTPADDPAGGGSTASEGFAAAGEPARPQEPGTAASMGSRHGGAGTAGAAVDRSSGPGRRSAVTAGTLPAVGRGAPPPARAGDGSTGRGGEGAAGSAGRRGALLGLLTAGAAVAAGGAAAVYYSHRAAAPGAGGDAAAATGSTVEATVSVRGMRFVPDTVEVLAGDRLVITVDNTSDMVHDLVLETGATTGRIAAGQSATLDAGTITAATEGWCSIAGHRAQGMVFHITVGAAATPSSPGHEQGHDQAGRTPSSSGQGDGEGSDAVPDYEAELPEGFTAFDATLPAASRSPSGPTTHRHTFTVTEKVMEVGGGVTQTRMTFNGQVPGPVLRGSVGDVFEITLVNEGTMSHSIDFHAGITPPDDAMRSISPGESLVYTFTAQHSGIWLYHCSTAPMSLHLASGMHGAVIIDPPGLEAVDRELVIVQSELYLGPEAGETSYAKVQARTPDLMAFNGVAFQYSQQPLRARVGQRLRFWVLDAGPSLPTSFHVVGLQFDQVFLEGAWTLGGPSQIGSQWSGGSQALGLQPAQGGFVECVPAEPGHYVFVTHSFADMEKGARGVLHVTS